MFPVPLLFVSTAVVSTLFEEGLGGPTKHTANGSGFVTVCMGRLANTIDSIRSNVERWKIPPIRNTYIYTKTAGRCVEPCRHRYYAAPGTYAQRTSPQIARRQSITL